MYMNNSESENMQSVQSGTLFFPEMTNVSFF